ncbi:MAG TPA: hypothetical protein PLK76_04130 [bacterium]|nr:hypothetical protein [bacterium]
MRKPYLKKLKTIGKITVWQVDGLYVRNHLNREFTNFGQHYRFPFIPTYEFWLDKEKDPGEEKYFIEHLLLEWRLMKEKGANFQVAIAKADRLERAERYKSEKIKKLSLRKNDPEIIKKIHQKILKKYSNQKVQVWLVDGELVRDLYFIDFVQGGHHYVYRFMPENEVWIDNDLSRAEYPFVILHELHERHLMRDKKLGYDEAHNSSSAIEYQCRKKKILFDKKLKNVLLLQ